MFVEAPPPSLLVRTEEDMKTFSKEDLKQCNGQGGFPVLIAYGGRVYDVSRSWHWKGGRHHALHKAGEDLTDDLSSAPHGEDLLDRVPVVGTLDRDEADENRLGAWGM